MASDDLIEPVVRIGATYCNASTQSRRAAKRGASFFDVLLAIAIGLGLFFALAHGLKVIA